MSFDFTLNSTLTDTDQNRTSTGKNEAMDYADFIAAMFPPMLTASASDDAEIAAWCREHLAAHKVPRYVVLVDALPHTPTHRVAKFKMRDDPTLRARATDLQAAG